MALSNQRNLTTVIIMMATTLLPLSGPLLASSPDLSKAHASADSLNTTVVASEFLDSQTNSMDEEIYPPAKWKSTKLIKSDLSSSPDKSQTFQQKENSSCLASTETSDWTRKSKSNMTKRAGFFEDPAGLVRIDADASPEGQPDSLHGDCGTYSRSMNCSGISSPNCTIKQFEKEYIDTSTSDAISEPPMNAFKPDLTLTFNCKGRCGMEMSFPCSCSASCVVYGMCCDNLTQDCPLVWEEGMTRFDHMLGADTVCHEDLIYMISSCPRSLRKDAEGKEVTLPTIRKQGVKKENISLGSQSPKLEGVGSSSETGDIIGFDSGKFSKSGRDVQESIVERLKLALSAAPVTDSNTGFTFINRSIYDCNNMSHGTALPWSVASEYTAVSPVMLEDLERFNFKNQYQFELNKEIFKAHQCLPDLVETCNQTADLEEMNQIHAEKCRERPAIIASRLTKTVFYRNIFCAYCNQGSHDRYSLYLDDKVVFRHQGFQLLMSLSDSGTINVRIFKPGVSKAILPWSHAHCPIPDLNTELSPSPGPIEEPANAESDRQSVCSVACLNNYFKAPTDGRCKTQHSAFLAIADDGLPPLCPSAMKGLANFLVCGLKSKVKSLIYADWSSPSVSAMFDASTNKTLYVVKINLDLISLTNYVFSTTSDDAIQNIYHVALLAKSFKNYRSSHDLCSRQDLKKQTLQSELGVIRTSSSIETYVGYLNLNMTLTEGMEQLRGPIVNKQDTTTVCLTAVHFSHKLKPKNIRCMEDLEHQRDESLLHDFRSSSCFSYLENLGLPDSNGADTAMPRDAIFFKMLVLAFIPLMVAFVKTI
ncbi:hypothetical protein PoB_001434700 [Plakobranchus ocellatus]|uniref:SMB domain-containing protein n=1 Tax=Plakobranchus ocellatus TaxID=259542 RepID=A0AAV3YXY3_9GAST|nr:hypothetical protein PoB_001434700 [Plakobranchus ocellatus]